MTALSGTAGGLTLTVDLLEEHFAEIFANFVGRLREEKSPLVRGEAARERLESLARSVLGGVAKDLRYRQPSADQHPGKVPYPTWVSGTRGEVHPCESLRAGPILAEAALSVLAKKLPPSVQKEEIVQMALDIQRSISDHVAAAGFLYVDHLLRELRESYAEERRRVSRELHDRVAPSITVTRRNLELYDLFKERDAPYAEIKVRAAQEMTHETLKHVRELSTELRSMEAEEGLEVAISDLLLTEVPSEMQAYVSAKGDDSCVEPHVRDQVFLVVRESIRNAVKHSGASNIRIKLSVSSNRIRVDIRNDGRGFDPKTAEHAGGVGLTSMRERIDLLGGKLELSSTPGTIGLSVSLCVPITSAAANPSWVRPRH